MIFTKHSITLLISVGLIFSETAFAGTSDIIVSNNQAGIQIISTNVDYTETGNGLFGVTGKLDTETGSVAGSALSISAMKDWWLGNDYIAAEYDHSSGNTNYVGGLIGPPPTPYGSVVGTSNATLINYSVRYGRGYVVNDELMLTPYVELGGHGWNRGVNFGETYTNHYYGVGALGQYSPVSKLVFSGNVMLGRTFGANIDVNGVFSGALGNSTLSKVGVTADYAFDQNLHGNVGIDYTSFNYGISALYPIGGNTVAWEPDSKTKYTMVKIGLGYAF